MHLWAAQLQAPGTESVPAEVAVTHLAWVALLIAYAIRVQPGSRDVQATALVNWFATMHKVSRSSFPNAPCTHASSGRYLLAVCSRSVHPHRVGATWHPLKAAGETLLVLFASSAAFAHLREPVSRVRSRDYKCRRGRWRSTSRSSVGMPSITSPGFASGARALGPFRVSRTSRSGCCGLW